MFASFEGQYREKPIQSLRGSSKSEDTRELLLRTQADRQKREELRTQQKCSVLIQAYYRSYAARKMQIGIWRGMLDDILLKYKSHFSPDQLRLAVTYLCHIFDVTHDFDRLVHVCRGYMQQFSSGELTISPHTHPSLTSIYQLQRLLVLCLRYLRHISASPSQPIAVPMRMLEIFTATETYTTMGHKAPNDTVCAVYLHIVNNGYFECMRRLLNDKVPSSLEKSPTPPTPIAASILDLIMKPIAFAEVINRPPFSACVLRAVCRSLLSPAYSDQIALFLLPAMAYGRYPFPLVELMQALIPADVTSNVSQSTVDNISANNVARSTLQSGNTTIQTGNTNTTVQSGSITSSLNMQSTSSTSYKTMDTKSGVSKKKETKKDNSDEIVSMTPWMLHSFLTISEHQLDRLNATHYPLYITTLQHLIPHLPAPSQHIAGEDDSDSEGEDHTMEVDTAINLESIRAECLRCLESPTLVQCLANSIHQHPSTELCTTVCVICCNLLAQQQISVHKSRLLYSLAFSSTFLRHLWQSCVSSHVINATGSKTPLLYMLSSGLPMSTDVTDTIVPLLTVFCSLFTHSLLTLHDQEFYSNDPNSTSMPFSTSDLIHMSVMLRDACLGIVDLAHPDSKHIVHNDYRHILEAETFDRHMLEDNTYQDELTEKWAFLFKVVSGLVRHLYTRDVRRPFCPHHHWLSQKVTIQYERPTQMYRAQNAMFVRRRFGRRVGPGNLRSNMRMPEEDEGQPLSNKEIRKLVILTEIPFVVPFEERVRVLQRLIADDKEQSQGDAEFAPFVGASINVMIRRNYIYEDAFEKLSTENEPTLKPQMRVQLINKVGLEEAGVDGGGLFREFLNELLKTGFDPNRGFFLDTVDHQLYPNPQAQLLNQDFSKHYYFLGRMLGKALYENMLVELPFANFFLSKILSRHGANLDIHHLASLDPEMYKHLISLKTLEVDVSELSLDFTIVRNDFGETKVIDLKPGGSNIAVTKDNLIEYVHLMADYFLNKQIRQHCSAFRQGVADVIDLDWLCMFDHHELQVLISGAHIPIDIQDLKRHTNYSGGYALEHPVIDLFWKVIASFSDDECRQLLKFVTSCSRPPLLGFKDLYPAFCIHHAGYEADRLPTSSTCMNLLKLPEFKDEATLRSKLVYAIESGAGFELS